MAATKEDKPPKNNDGKNDFATISGHAPAHESLTQMLNRCTFLLCPIDRRLLRAPEPMFEHMMSLCTKGASGLSAHGRQRMRARDW